MTNYVSSFDNGATVDALLNYVNSLTLNNSIGTGIETSVICGGGSASYPNKIGYAGKPAGTDVTPVDWSDDTGYVAGNADVATIVAGYDHINNQLAGTICGGGHNFLKYNSNGHSFIGGGSYNLISAGRSAIVAGRRNTITGSASVYDFIGAGDDNNVVGNYCNILGGLSNNIYYGSTHSNILGGTLNAITGFGSNIIAGSENVITGTYSNAIGRANSIVADYGFAIGRKGSVTAKGAVAFTDSTDAVFSVGTQNAIGMRFNGGYWLTGGSVGIGTTSPSAKAALDITSTTKGFLPPRMTTEQRDAISTPDEGLQIYNLTTHKLNFYNGSAWETVTSSV